MLERIKNDLIFRNKLKFKSGLIFKKVEITTREKSSISIFKQYLLNNPIALSAAVTNNLILMKWSGGCQIPHC